MKIVEAYFKFNNKNARWEPVSDVLAFSMVDGFRRKFVFENGVVVLRGIGEPLFDDDGKIPELDGDNESS